MRRFSSYFITIDINWNKIGTSVVDMRKILEYVKPFKMRMLFGFCIKVFGTFMDLGLPWILAHMIDEVTPKGDQKMIFFWGLVMVLLSIGGRTLNITANRMASKVARDSVGKLRHDVFEKVMYLSSAQVDYYTVPSLISRLTTDTYNIHQMIGVMQRLGVRAPIILVGGIIITLTLEPVLTLILIAILPLIGVLVYLVSKKGIPIYKTLQTYVDQLVLVVRENISGIRVIKALSKTDYEKERFKKVNDSLVNQELKAGSTMAITGPTVNLLLNLGLTFVVILGAFRVNAGASEVGKIVAFLSYFTIMLQAMMAITRIFVIASKASASATRLEEILNTRDDLEVQKIAARDSNFHIEFDQVSFSYHASEFHKEQSKESSSNSGQEEYVIENINFSLKKGESLGIIGSTGAGKSTLIQLLLRFYDVTKGAIRINGRDIKSIPLEELRGKFGVVFQNDAIFASTIGENIDFYRGLNEQEVENAAICSQAYPFIQEIETGFEYQVSAKGSNLSGGQKQRVLIARALADKPEILVLDDSSSALDYKTDAMLRKELGTHYQDTTTILIAQRVSSVMNLDYILVIEEGKVIGLGNHEYLLQTCDVYKEIYDSQMGEGGEVA